MPSSWDLIGFPDDMISGDTDHYTVPYTRFGLGVENEKLTRDGTAKPVPRDQIHIRERGKKKIFPLFS